MPINFHEKSGEFHIYNNEISYIFKILKNGELGQLYFGKHLQERESFEHMFREATRDMSAYIYEGDSNFSMENIKQEYPSFGHGDPRYPAFEMRRENGSNIVEFEYCTHRIYDGKPKLSGLPATYAEEEEATTLEVTLEDKKIHAKIKLLYTVFEMFPAIARSAKFEYSGDNYVTLTTAMSGCFDFPDKDYTMIDLAGAWARERYVKERKIDYGVQEIHSMRGCSSYQFNPFIALKRKNADENVGEVYGFSLVYSGSYQGKVEVDNYDVTRVTLGIHPDVFQWKMEKGDMFQTPEIVAVYSDKGINGMSQTYHKLYGQRLVRKEWRDKERPILLNNWEVTYFDFNEKAILDLAEQGKEMGVELFVLDDGWFGERDDSTSSLGDWYVNERKLPNGLKSLAEKIDAMGLKFGIWIEPEMVCKKSNLFRTHPEWVLGEVERNLCHSRNQYVLDFSKKEIRDYIFEMLEKAFLDAPISYVKWDMNRTFSEVYSNGNNAEYQGKLSHQYILGVYEMYERLIERFPQIMFESCASGGARFDPGMMHYAPLGWISDNTDAVDRLKIQYGTSYVYPLITMGSHVSPSPNHQNGRITSLEMRGNVAMFGTFGYEMNFSELTSEEKQVIKEQIAFMKHFRSLIQKGKFYRLLSPFEGNETAWMVVSEDGKEAVVGYYRILNPVNSGFKYLKLQGLNSSDLYEIDGSSTVYYGDELKYRGLDISDYSSGCRLEGMKVSGDFSSKIYHLKSKE